MKINLVLALVLNLMSIGICFGRSIGQFCDNSFVDAVLWDGLTYKLTRNEWIATYDSQKGTVGQLVHLSDDNFQNEKGYYYQSVYHIPTVPECNETTVSCEMMDELKGVTVYVIRRYRSAEKDDFEIIHRIYRKGVMRSPVPTDRGDINIETFIESNLLPKLSLQKYRPSVYSPKDLTFIHITNQYQNFGPLLETIQLQRNGVIERSYHELNEYKDIVFITSFWWTFDKKLYIIGEHKTGFGNPFIYELQIRDKNIVLKPINKSVLEFFGCNKHRENYLEKSIRTKISEYDLGHWSVKPVPVQTTTAHNKALSSQRERLTTPSRIPPVRPTSRSNLPPPITLPKQTIALPMTTFPPYQTEYQIRTGQRDQRIPTNTEQWKANPSTLSPVPKTTAQRIDRIYDRTAQALKASTVRVPIFSGQVRVQPTPQVTIPSVSIDSPWQNTANTQAENEKTTNLTLPEINIAHLKKYVSMKVSDFWKLFPTIVMITFLLTAILVLILGFFAVFNLRNILKSKVKQTTTNLKNQRVKYDDGFHDFFIEEYNTSPKRIPSVDNNSCQTNESFESTDDCNPARTVL